MRYLEADFIRNRITQLRLQKGVSEYQMSYDLGHSRSYMYNISSGIALPPMLEFLQICDYFGITPAQFFDESLDNPALLQTAINGLKQLDDDDLRLIISNINRLCRDKYKPPSLIGTVAFIAFRTLYYLEYGTAP